MLGFSGRRETRRSVIEHTKVSAALGAVVKTTHGLNENCESLAALLPPAKVADLFGDSQEQFECTSLPVNRFTTGVQPMLSVFMLYAAVAVLTSLGCCLARREWYWELFTADALMAGVGAWVGGVAFGSSMGPEIAGIPVAACFLFAVPFAALFNLFFAPAPVAVSETIEVPAELPLIDSNILNLPTITPPDSVADVA